MKKNLGFTKETIKNIGLSIFIWSKKNKVIALILCLMFFNFCINEVKQVHNILLYGDYKLVARYPIEKTSYFALKPVRQVSAIKIDSNNIIFFISQRNKVYKIINLNLKTKKISNFTTFINANYIHFASLVGNKIYLGYYENQHTYVFAVFDYKTDKIIKIKVGNTSFGEAKVKIKLGGQDYILFAKHNEEVPDKKIKNKNAKFIPPHEQIITKSVYNFTLYNPKNNIFRKIFDLETNTDKIIAELENGSILSYSCNAKANSYTIDIIDLEKNKISSTLLDFKASMPTFIWLGENKFMVIYEYYKSGREKGRLGINTYKITSKNKIEKLCSKEVENHGLFDTFTEFVPRSYVVLSPEAVLFVGGFNGKIGLANYSKDTHIYNPTTNILKKITNFPYKNDGMSFLPFNNSTFFAFNASRCSWWFGCRESNKIYKLKLK